MATPTNYAVEIECTHVKATDEGTVRRMSLYRVLNPGDRIGITVDELGGLILDESSH